MSGLVPVWLVTADSRVIQLGHSEPRHTTDDLDEAKASWAKFARSTGHRVAYVAICEDPPPVQGGRKPVMLPAIKPIDRTEPDSVIYLGDT